MNKTTVTPPQGKGTKISTKSPSTTSIGSSGNAGKGAKGSKLPSS